MAEVAQAYVSLMFSAKGSQGQITNELAGTGARGGDAAAKGFRGRFGSGVAKVGGVLAGVFAIGAAKQFFGDAIAGASDLAESASKVKVVFGEQADQIMRTSKTSAAAMGLSKQAYLDAAGGLGNLLVSLKIAPKQAAGMSQRMVKLAGDLASFNNVSPDEALLALRSGLTGETEPLKRFGVNMNDATLKAQALKDGLIKNTKHALTPQQKALAAQALIMAQTTTAQGDFARTSGGLANQQRILAAKVKNLKDGIGGALLPVVTKMTTWLTAKAVPAVQRFANQMQSGKGAGGKFADVLRNIVNAVKGTAGFINSHRVAVAALIGVYLAYRGTLAAVAVAQRINTAVTAVSSAVTWANTTARAANESLLVTWLGVKALEAGAWLRGVAGTVASTAAMVANKVVYGVSWLATFIAVKALEAGAWLRSVAGTVAATAALVAHKAITLAISVATKAWVAVQWLLNAALTANPIGLIVAAVALLIAGVILAWKKSALFRAIVLTLWAALKQVGSFIAGAFVAALHKLSGVFSAVWGLLKRVGSFLGHVFVGYLHLLEKAWLTVAIVAVHAMRGLLKVVLNVFGGIVHAAAKGLGWIPGIGPKVRKAAGAFDAFRNHIVDKLGDVEAKLKAVRDGIGGIKSKHADISVQIHSNLSSYTPKERLLLTGHRASGGPVKAGGHYLVGEDGPELFSPKRGGSIIPQSPARGANITTPSNDPMRGKRVALVVGERVFDAYVSEVAESRIRAHKAHDATKGRQR